MKKLLLVCLFCLASWGYADDLVSTTGEGMGTQVHIGRLDLLIPLNNVDVTYLYDLIHERSLVGGETPIARLWVIEGTIGAVTSIDGHGAPFVGGNIVIPNPAPNIAVLGTIKPGVWGGYSWNDGAAIAGIKASMPIF